MARPSRFNLRLQNLVLLVLVPGLLLSTALFGWSIYRGVYGIILNGFDRKLSAVSTVTGAFIRGEDHDLLFEPHRIAALAGGDGEALIGLDRKGGKLVRIDPEEGGALEWMDAPADAIAIATESGGALWVATSDPNLLHRIDPATGRTEAIFALEHLPEGLAYDARLKVLYVGGPELRAIDPASGRSVPLQIEGLAGPVRAPALSGAGDRLYLIQGDPGELVVVDLEAARARPLGAFRPLEPVDAEPSSAPFGPRISDLAVGADDVLYGVSDRLLRIEPRTAGVDSSGSAIGFRSSQHPLYQEYVAPMRRIMAKQTISYLYTETVGLGGVLTYGIDATEGENHSVIGSTESISDEELAGMERAMVQGEVRLSEIESWGAWGLLKTADAPIYREDGSIAALAAADVDITLILEKTRVALVKVGVIAAITLLLGGLVSFLISRRLVSPLTEVKEGALQLAAGQYGHRIAEQELLELRELSESFNSMSEALAGTIGELTKTNLELEHARRGRALELVLAEDHSRARPGLPFLLQENREPSGGEVDPSGHLWLPGRGGGRVIAWIADRVPGSALEQLQLRREIATLAHAIVGAAAEPQSADLAFLAQSSPRIRTLVLLDGATRTVRGHARSASPIALMQADGTVRLLDLSIVPVHALGETEWAVLSTGDPERAGRWMLRERIGAIAFAPGAPLDPSRRESIAEEDPRFAVALFGRGLLGGIAPAANERWIEAVVGV